MEARYIATCEAAKEAIWLRKVLIDLQVVLTASQSLTLYCDNSGAVANSKKPRSYKRAKYIERKYHLIREFIKRGDVKMCKVATELNTADPLTKALPQPKHERHYNALGLRHISDWS